MDQRDWATDFDHFDPRYAADPFAVWADLRAGCPVARSPRFRDMVVPVRADDIEAVARDVDTWSSRSPLVADFGSMADFGIVAPPISSDPPYHTSFRKLLLPFFSPQRMEALRPAVEARCDELLDALGPADVVDVAAAYAQHIPVHVITLLLGIPPEDGDRFRTWIHQLLERGPVDIEQAATGLFDFGTYLGAQIQERMANDFGGDDLISFLVGARLDDRSLSADEVFGGCLLLLVAGIDTTWSAIGASLWHLAGHPEDQRRLREDPALLPSAVEELLRAYAPVTMAREARVDTELGGCPVHAGDPLLLPFPAANRDPDRFERADEVVLDRSPNRHVAFGIGIHRCLGSHLARLEVSVALERFLARTASFELAVPAAVRWSTGQVRGPRALPLRVELA
ncbi:MAG: cytochrome P450 [Acidimicrobiales bacterium]